ncbi:putative phage abortive infection protein [Candidatus Parabeggiatoa sp. HSG14]|uniref:putative phage abortive infection protein n=1 Tax=Candidatus Parabeggiatoa sp. HSG14 TaxID=3055593 RepID=UPI0025A733B1|nr:putative phage abortive infection protein [Thiotrichales bacterium HSG14]
MKKILLCVQFLAIILLFIGCHVQANDDVLDMTQHYEENNTQTEFVETKTESVNLITYLKNKHYYLLVLILILLGVIYLVYLTKQQTNKVAQEVGDLKQVVVKKLVRKDATQRATERDSLLSKILPTILLSFGVFSIVLFITIVSTYFYYFDWPIPSQHDKWGTFGDFFGGTLNSIFSLFGFVALLLTIVLQGHELALSRHELRISANALHEQSQSVRLQQFESTFFTLLELHKNIVNALKMVLPDGTVYRGSEALSKCLDSFLLNFSSYYDDKELDKETIFKEFLRFIKANYGISLTHYFSHLYNLLDFLDIDRTNVFVDNFGKEDKDGKKFYMKIIRSSLTKGETGLLFYAGISNRPNNCGLFKNRAIIEKYALLVNAKDMGWVKQEHCVYYKDSAFEEDD